MGKRKWFSVNRNKHCVYRLDYHLVFVVKYRKPCITEEMGKALVEESRRIVAIKGGSLLEGKSDKDHLHLLISLPPAVKLSDVVGTLKMATSKMARGHFREDVEKYLSGPKFWSPSYYIASAGGADLSTLTQYIQDQGLHREKKKQET